MFGIRGKCQSLSIDYDINITDEDLESLLTRIQNTTIGDRISRESLSTPGLASLDGSRGRSISRTENHEASPSPDGTNSQTIFSDHENALQDFILESLSFSSMKDREEGVDIAHDSTFEWIFDSNRMTSPGVDSLSKWLQKDGADGIFWVNGKAGSGKSTLMRFIIDHPKTQELLRIWAGEKTLITAGFYFWISGTVEQRSQTGLLRYLLFQLLSSRRHLIHLVFPERWERLKTSSTRDRVRAGVSWELSELANALNRFAYSVRHQERICLFVDGLDEFDGDHQQIADFFGAISSHQHVKICLSSRPLPVFWSSFGHTSKIQLHELTYTDMIRFVHDRFDDQPQMHVLTQANPEAALVLVNDIAKKADGVFLWVSLVVRSLLHEPHYSEISKVYSRLQALPTELDDLFQHILFNGKSQYDMNVLSRLFQLMRAREIACDVARHEGAASMTVWEFALADQICYQAALANDIQEADEEEVFTRCRKLQGQLENQCAGLIVMHDRLSNGEGLGFRFAEDEAGAQKLAENKIAYIHRTVKDFLAQPEIFSKVVSLMTDDDFDPNACLLGSYISQLKLPLQPFRRHRQIDDWWPGIVLSMTHARYIDKENQTIQSSLIRELDKTISAYWLPKEMPSSNDHWARNVFGTYEKRKRMIFHEPFLSLTAKFGLANYVRACLDEGYQYQGGIPLLGHCIEFLVDRRKSVYPLSQPDLVAILLRYGEDPNQGYRDLDRRERTPWLLALDCLREGDRCEWMRYYDLDSEGMTRYAKIIELLITHGADPNAILVETQFDPSNTALEVITMVYEKYASPQFERLQQMLIERGAQWRVEK